MNPLSCIRSQPHIFSPCSLSLISLPRQFSAIGATISTFPFRSQLIICKVIIDNFLKEILPYLLFPQSDWKIPKWPVLPVLAYEVQLLHFSRLCKWDMLLPILRQRNAIHKARSQIVRFCCGRIRSNDHKPPFLFPACGVGGLGAMWPNWTWATQ